MSYTLYVTDNCPACDRVREYLISRDIQFELINIGDPGANPVEGVLIYPALLCNNALHAYGDDIISWLERERVRRRECA